MRLTWDDTAPDWNAIRRDPVYRDNFAAGLEELDHRFGTRLASATNVLDVACGTGMAARMVAERLPNTRVTCVDISKRMVDIARREVPAGTFLVASTTGTLPFADHSFDLVVSCDGVFSTRELVRVLAPGGVLLIAYTHRSVPVYRPLERLARELRDHGLEADVLRGPGEYVFGSRNATVT